MHKHSILLALAAATQLTACAVTPNYDARFGDAVRQARLQQTLDPDASNNLTPVTGIDGPAAKEAIGRYQDSFKTPPPTFNVINIGGDLSGAK